MNKLQRKGRQALSKMRPRKNSPFSGDLRSSERPDRNTLSDSTLSSANLRKAVMLPDGEDENEWPRFKIFVLSVTCLHAIYKFAQLFSGSIYFFAIF